MSSTRPPDARELGRQARVAVVEVERRLGQLLAHRVDDPARFGCELVATLEPLCLVRGWALSRDHPCSRGPANMGTTPSLRLIDDAPERTRCAAFAEIDAGCLQQQPSEHELSGERRVHVARGGDAAQSVHLLIRPGAFGG